MTRYAYRHAAKVLARGGVALYPTEGVWGLGCDPLNLSAVARILEIKQRPADKGLILIAYGVDVVRPFLNEPATVDALRAKQGERPTTWVVPAADWVPAWLTGGRDTLAVRITQHPVAAALSCALGAPLVSTSANLAGRPAPTRRFAVSQAITQSVDVWMGGQTGQLKSATPIFDLISGVQLRAG